MGIYLNPDNVNFEDSLREEVYVDKTMMIDVINHFIDIRRKYICVSRPRRFGKTVAQNMFAAYYSRGCDSRGLFDGLKISQMPGYQEKMNHYNVIQIDMNSEYEAAEDKENTLKILLDFIKSEFREQFPDVPFQADDSVPAMMLRVYSKKKETFIILIDEYDVLVRENVSQKLFDDYMSLLNALFKSNTLKPAITLAYITGILPIVRDRVQSKLNNFKEYTMVDAKELSEFVGFTSAEVEELCGRYHVDYNECRLWYDGYRQHGIEIYNPESVLESVTSGYFEDYWGKTSTYKVIKDRIDDNFEGMRDDVVRMIAGENVAVNVREYMNTMTDFDSKDDAFTYLIHTGYLAYDRETKTCRIPNEEIRGEWQSAIRGSREYRVTNEIIRASHELLEETWRGNEQAVAKALDVSHINVTANRSYNNEDCLQSAIYLAYIDALNSYTVVKEMTAGKGFADLVYIPVIRGEHPAMIIELKRNHSADSALSQIKEKRYFDSLAHYQGNLLFVGINYDENTKTHECHMEHFVKEA